MSFMQNWPNRLAVARIRIISYGMPQPHTYDIEMKALGNCPKVLRFAELDCISLAQLLTAETSFISLSEIRLCVYAVQ